MLRGRHGECAVLDGLLSAVRTGISQALVVRGEEGVGKTALLEYLIEQASSCRVARATGVQSEIELAFAGLHQLCGPMLDRLEQLPGPQRDALAITFGLTSGAPPDRFLVGLAVLGLFAEIARERPLICVVDDAQWLDHASAHTLAFVGRRLRTDSVLLVFAMRDFDGMTQYGLPELTVTGLADQDARALLDSVLRGPVDERVRDRIISETRGNPLALLELPKGLTAAELTGGFGPPADEDLWRQIEQSYRRQLEQLEPQARRLLLVASAEPLGDPVLLWRAAKLLEIDADAELSTAGLLEIGTRVRFRHPLVRSAVYRAASGQERHAAHRALAEATDPDHDPDRHAWHRAQAVSGPDENIAVDLERSAGRARARGGLASSAAFFERAAKLTLNSTRRADCLIASAQAAHLAGIPDVALGLLSQAQAGSLDELRSAQVGLLRAQIAFVANRGGDAARLLLGAARQLMPLNVRLARDTYLDALAAAMFAGPLGADISVRAVARAAIAAGAPASPRTAADLLLDGLVSRFTDGYAASVPKLRPALQAFRSPELPREEGLRWLWLAHVSAVDVWDEAWDVLAARHVRLARDAGALSELPLALSMRISAHVLMGELEAASALVEELAAVTEATGSQVAPYGPLLLAAWRGREREAMGLIDGSLMETARRGEGIGLIFTGWAKAVLSNGLGRYGDALAAATQATEHPQEMGAPTWGALVELVEAAIRNGQVETAANAHQRLSAMARPSGTDWASGIEARSRALLAHGSAAESAYREAVGHLRGTRIRGELARAHLLYGEWLRREGRRADARAQLRTAHDMFIGMGAEAFGQRAARELQVTGEVVRKRNSVETSDTLTAQEAQIIRLVREGLSNPEIAARLFLSPRTVEWHLSNVFGKLRVSSRRQL